MANSYFNIITFLLTTLLYYTILKPGLTYKQSINPDEFQNYISSNYMYLAIYFLLVLIIQFMVNASVISSTCGGNITENMGAAGVFTFLPWTLIFGVIIVILTIYPGFKSAFSDVIGYYWVSSSANRILTELLVNKEIETSIDTDVSLTPEQKAQMQGAADTILKICGNTSILINQIVPQNFNDYWNLLNPLMKDKYKTSSAETDAIRDELFDLVITRDNVGEFMWYLYTGILLTSIVQLKITSRGCANNPKTMEQNYQKFKESEEKAAAAKAQATNTTYTL